MNEYQEGHRNVKKFIALRKEEGTPDYDYEKELSMGMSWEMKNNIESVRQQSRTELLHYLSSPESSVLTERQRSVMVLRAEGSTLEEIGNLLGISKQAVAKLIKKSEKKIYGMLQ